MLPQARELWQQGRPRAATRLQHARWDPADPAQTLSLWEMSLLTGRFRAAQQAVAALPRTDNRTDNRTDEWADYRADLEAVLRAVRRRQRGQYRPWGRPPGPVARARVRLWQATTETRARWADRADRHARPVVAHVDGQEVEELRDVDERYGPCLEFLAGPFAWIVDWEPIRTVRFAPVLTLLDTVYRPVSLSFWAGQSLSARVPMVYPEALRDRPRFLLGLASEIQEEPSGLIVGRGGRRFWTPVGEFDLGSCRQLDLRPA